MEQNKRSRGRPVGSFRKKIPTWVNGKRSKAYEKYNGMKQRCYNPNSNNYKWYGARGISVEPRWLGSEGFNNFVIDMGEPLPGMTLGRIDNDKNYGPGNCRWETRKEQCRNRRKGGPEINPQSLRQKAIAAGLPYARVYQRIHVLGWPVELALSTPIMPAGRPKGIEQ